MIRYLKKATTRGACKKGVFRNFAKFTGKKLSQSLFYCRLRPAAVLKKETLAQVFSCEFYEISKNTFSYRTPPEAASVLNIYRFSFEKFVPG